MEPGLSLVLGALAALGLGLLQQILQCVEDGLQATAAVTGLLQLLSVLGILLLLHEGLQGAFAGPRHQRGLHEHGHSAHELLHRCLVDLHQPCHLLLEHLDSALQHVLRLRHLTVTSHELSMLPLANGLRLIQICFILGNGRTQIIDAGLSCGNVGVSLLNHCLQGILGFRRVLQLVLLLLGVLLAPYHQLLKLLLLDFAFSRNLS
mmetsp:Transcript_12484/g.27600  ORF Transcript_12484/g.27600 Transcript_12484/m.27600 type:complete len:206 (-) Transcript_12484:143-760(-)